MEKQKYETKVKTTSPGKIDNQNTRDQLPTKKSLRNPRRYYCCRSLSLRYTVTVMVFGLTAVWIILWVITLFVARSTHSISFPPRKQCIYSDDTTEQASGLACTRTVDEEGSSTLGTMSVEKPLYGTTFDPGWRPPSPPVVRCADIVIAVSVLHWESHFDSDPSVVLGWWHPMRQWLESKRMIGRLYLGIFARATAELYFHAPESAGWGGWTGASPSDICAAISRPATAKHWDNNPEECARMLHSRFESIEIITRYLVLFSLGRAVWNAVFHLISISWSALVYRRELDRRRRLSV